MFDLLIMFAAASGAQATAATAADPVPALSQIPGVTVRHYVVQGETIDQIKQSMASTRPSGSDGNPVAASVSWQIGASIGTSTTDGQCAITRVTPTFTATAELPRHAMAAELKPQLQKHWSTYVAGLEASVAAHLDFVRDRLPQIQQAVAAASCEGADAALTAATERVKAQETAFLAQRAAQKAADEQKALEQRNAAPAAKPAEKPPTGQY